MIYAILITIFIVFIIFLYIPAMCLSCSVRERQRRIYQMIEDEND